MLDKLYTVKETAGTLRVSMATIRAWRFQKRLQGIKIGRRVMFSEDEIQRFIDLGKKVKA
jgi:excisionase family DNA binding protein